jgi:hypothetical protein
MRFAKLIFALTLSFTAGLAFGQTQQDDGPISAERDLTKSVHIFPNPAVEYVHVEVAELPASKVVLAVHNLLGNKIDLESEVVGEHELRVKVKDLATGYYLLAIKDDEAKFRGTYKFLKR